MKTDDELKTIAVDMYDGKIFSDKHMQDQSKMTMVFMPLALGGFKDKTEEEINDIGMLYEYLSEAGPRSINGMPMFFSMRYLKKDETEKMFEYYDEYKKLKDNFKNNNKITNDE